VAHETRDPMAAHPQALCTELVVDPRRAIDPPARRVCRPDVDQERRVAVGLPRQRTPGPRVEAAA